MKYSLTYEAWDASALEAGETDIKGFLMEDETWMPGTLRFIKTVFGPFAPSDSEVQASTFFYTELSTDNYAGEARKYNLHVDTTVHNKQRLARVLR